MKREAVVLNRQACWECVALLVFREKITHDCFLPQNIKNLKLLLASPTPFAPASLCFGVSSAETSAFHSRFPSPAGFSSVFALTLERPIRLPHTFLLFLTARLLPCGPLTTRRSPGPILTGTSHLSPRDWLYSDSG